MTKDQSFHDYVVYDLFKDCPGITSRAMFGGWGIYQHGIIFAIIAAGELYFKVDDQNRTEFETFESHPFVYGDHKKTVTMSYWLIPEEIMEDRERLQVLVKRSVEASQRNTKK